MAGLPSALVSLSTSVPKIDHGNPASRAGIVGQYWSDQILHGFRALARLDRDQYLEVRFEDLLTQPRATLEQISDHLELPSDRGFLDRAAALVRGFPEARFASLPAEEREELRRACRPGQVLLGRADEVGGETL